MMRSSLPARWHAAMVLLAIALLRAGPAAAQPTDPDTAAIDAIFARHAGPDTPGCALGVMRAGDLVLARGFGMASLEHGVPITPASIFHVASVSKQFTVAALALLEQDGVLSLDDDVRRWLPELHDFGPTITIRQLIHHTSGLRDQWELLAMAGWRGADVKTQADILELASRQRELNFEPGSQYLYSNTGYTLMAVIVERATGRSLRDFADARIFRPLGMHATHFHDDHTEIVPGRVTAYGRRADGSMRVSMPIYDNIGATSLNTTVGDLARWDRNFYDPVVGGPALLDLLHRRGVLSSGDTIDYAGALMISSWQDVPVVQHSGADAGFRAQFMRFPDERLSIAVLCNVSDGDPGRLARAVAAVYLRDRLARAAAASTAGSTAAGAHAGARARAAEPAPALSSAQLHAYVGSYHSPELDTVWDVVLAGDALALRRRRFPDMPLAPTAPDVFRGWQLLRFTRDEAGEIDGFTATGGRVLNLRFERLPR